MIPLRVLLVYPMNRIKNNNKTSHFPSYFNVADTAESRGRKVQMVCHFGPVADIDHGRNVMYSLVLGNIDYSNPDNTLVSI